VNPKPKKLLDQVRDVIQAKHYARNAEQSYVYWIKKYTLFQRKQHLGEGGFTAIACLEYFVHREYFPIFPSEKILKRPK